MHITRSHNLKWTLAITAAALTPMTVTGKIQKYRMREIAVAELGLKAAT